MPGLNQVENGKELVTQSIKVAAGAGFCKGK